MKNSTMRWMMAAAALVVAAGSASAQTYRAEMPMAFRAGQSLLAAGSYEFRVSTGQSTQIFVYNLQTKSSAILNPNVRSDAPKDWQRAGDPRIGLDCSGSTCTLRRFWTATDTFAYTFPASKEPTLEARRTEVVTLAMTRVR